MPKDTSVDLRLASGVAQDERVTRAGLVMAAESARWFTMFAGGNDASQAAEALDAACLEFKRATAAKVKAASRRRKRAAGK